MEERESEKKIVDRSFQIEIAKNIIAIMILIIGLGTVLYYLFGPGVGYLHADCTDTMYWAKASYDSGRWISDNFRYAALLPFGGNLLMLFFMPFFGFSITTHNLGMLLFVILFALSAYLACRAFEMSRRFSISSVGILLLAVSASDKMREIFWGHVIYYSLAVVLLFFGIALMGQLSKRFYANKLTIWRSLAAMLYFALVALDGGQMLVLVTLPLLAAVFLERFLSAEKLRTPENHFALIFLAILVVSVPVGLIALKIISHGVTAGYAQVYSNWVAMSDWSNNLLKLPTEWFRLFGLDVNARMPLFSVESVGNLIRLAAAIIIAVGPVWILFLYPKIKNRNIRLMTIVHFTISAFILIGYICGMLATANWRLSPMIVTGLFLVLMYLSEYRKGISFSGRIAFLGVFVIACFCVVNAMEIRKMPWNYNRDKDVYQVADFLEQKGLDYGFATFWNSQLITMYTGEKVKARNMIINDKGHSFESYQSEYTWGDAQEGQEKYFLLFSKSEYRKWLDTPKGELLKPQVIQMYEDVNGFVILVFDHLI